MMDNLIIPNKKAPANAEARPLPPCYPYCGLRGGDILLFVFLVCVVLLFNYTPVWPCVAAARSSIALTTEALASDTALATACVSFD